jgi:hypothetical protein
VLPRDAQPLSRLPSPSPAAHCEQALASEPAGNLAIITEQYVSLIVPQVILVSLHYVEASKQDRGDYYPIHHEFKDLILVNQM